MLSALVLASSLCASNVVLAQTANPQQAADMDWVKLDQLSEAQKARIPQACCGLYVEPPAPQATGNPDNVNIDGTNIATDPKGLTEINGKIFIQQGALRLTADRGSYDDKKQLLTASSNIVLRQKGMLLTGASVTVDGVSKISQLISASYLLHTSAVRGHADKIVYKEVGGIITIDNGVFTRCEPGDNAWELAGERIVLDRDRGIGTARDLTLRIKDIPVMYLPWIRFPINDERATGFLAPVLGSRRYGGFDVAAPFYLNLAPNIDATITPRLQTNRGVMFGAETRYLGATFAQQLDVEYLHGDQTFDPLTVYQPGSNSPPTPNRWSTKYKFGADLGAGWTAGINYRAVSDQDFFRDFGRDGLSSTTQSYLYRNASINYRDRHWDFSVSTENLQLIDPSVSSLHEPYRTQPRIKLDGLYWLPFGLQYGVNSEYTVFDRNFDLSKFSKADIANGALVTGSRLAITPELSLPLTTAYSWFIPTLKYKYADWSLKDQALLTSDSPSRGIASANIDAGLIFERDSTIGGTHFRQTLEPRLYYLNNQYKDQSQIPLFDTSELTFSFNQLFRDDRFSGKDRVGDANQLTYAVTSRLFNDQGQEKALVSVGRIQSFAAHRVALLGTPGVPVLVRQSALAGEMSYQVSERWRTGSYLEWDSHTNRADVGNVQLQYQQDSNHLINLAWRYRDMPAPIFVNGLDRRIKQSDVSAVWPIVANWNVVGRWNYDYSNTRTLEGIGGIEYSNCCWRVRLVARSWIDNHALYFGREDNNHAVFVQFELKGLGSILGGNVSGILNNGISGFQDRNNELN